MTLGGGRTSSKKAKSVITKMAQLSLPTDHTCHRVARKPSKPPLKRLRAAEADLFLAIGEFILEFSELEFTIRHLLGSATRSSVAQSPRCASPARPPAAILP